MKNERLNRLNLSKKIIKFFYKSLKKIARNQNKSNNLNKLNQGFNQNEFKRICFVIFLI